MKKILILTFMFILCLSSLTVQAIIYNEGPEPENPYYLHYQTRKSTSNSTPVINDVWIYIPEENTNKWLLEDYDYPENTYCSYYRLNSNENFNEYTNGVTTPKVTNYTTHMLFDFINNNYPKLTVETVRQKINGEKYIYNQFVHETFGGFFELTVFKNTIPIKTSDGEIVIFPEAQAPEYETEEWLRIISPLNGFVQSGGLTTWSIRVGYQFLLTEDFNLSEWEIKPHSDTIKGIKVTGQDNFESAVMPYKYIQGYMTADYYVPIGTHEIYFTMVNKRTGQALQSQTFIYKNYEGFVDNNSDGLDDRSGLDESIGGVPPDWNLGTPPSGGINFNMPDLSTVLSTLQSFLNIIIEPITIAFKGVPELYMLMLFGLAVGIIKFALGR